MSDAEPSPPPPPPTGKHPAPRDTGKAQAQAELFPPADFVRQGPPLAVRDLDRQSREKWAKLMVVFPAPLPAPPGDTGPRRHVFVTKGPYTLPLATLREGADKGSKDAWQFFSHPFAVFPQDSAFYNVSGKGVLGARLSARGRGGFRIYDEVGAQIPDSERVVETFPGAMGVLRHRALGKGEQGTAFARDLVDLDLDLLELFRLSTLLMKTLNPREGLSELDRLLQKPTVRRFAADVFDKDDLEAISMVAGDPNLDEVQAAGLANRFRVDEADFTQVTQVKDEKGRQAIAELLAEFKTFEDEHGAKVAELNQGITTAERKLAEVKTKILDLQRSEAQRLRITKIFSRGAQTIAELKAEGVHAIRTKRALEAAFDELPGYMRVRGLSARVQGFEATVKTIHRLAGAFFDHNVSQAQLKSMRQLAEKLDEADAVNAKAAWKSYDLRLRADVLPRVLSTYSLSAYVARRPDALNRGHSLRNVHRINRLARDIIEYFRWTRYGQKTVGEAFDETWGQVVALEERF